MDTLFYKSPIGWIEIGADKQGICKVSLVQRQQENIRREKKGNSFRRIYEENGRSKASEDQQILNKIAKLLWQAQEELTEYFAGKRQNFTVPLSLHGTEFQRKVWNALCEIPYGETRSYAEIAKVINNPKGYRAVGMANHRNPIMVMVPCHRVVGTNGNLTGYAGGLDVKQQLLALEKRHKLL